MNEIKNFLNGFTSFCYDNENKRFLCITNDALLLEIAENDFSAKYVIPQNNNISLKDFLAYNSCFYKGKFYFFNFDGTKYVVYDSKCNELKEYFFEGVEATLWDKRKNILDVSIYNNEAYVFFGPRHIVFVIDLVAGNITRTISYDTNENVYFAFEKDRQEYLLSDSKIFTFNYITELMAETKKNDYPRNVQDVFSNDEKLYFLSTDGFISAYKEGQKTNEIKLDKCKKNDYSFLIVLGDKIWLFPKLGEDIVRLYDGDFLAYKEYDSEFGYIVDENWLKIGFKYTNYISTDERIYFPTRIGNKMCSINKLNGSIQWYSIQYPSNEERMELMIRNNKIVYEDKNTKLKEFIIAVV